MRYKQKQVWKIMMLLVSFEESKKFSSVRKYFNGQVKKHKSGAKNIDKFA
jgi:hypothetical protein